MDLTHTPERISVLSPGLSFYYHTNDLFYARESNELDSITAMFSVFGPDFAYVFLVFLGVFLVLMAVAKNGGYLDKFAYSQIAVITAIFAQNFNQDVLLKV